MTAVDSLSLLDAAIHRAAVIPLDDRTHLEIHGQDRATFLHNFCTNHIKGLTAGQGCEAFVTSIKGRILGHILVYAGAGSLLLETVRGQASALLSHLDRYIITEDVQLADRTNDWSQLYISGSEAGSLLQAACSPPDFAAGAGPRVVACGAGTLRRFSMGTAPGYALVGPRDWVGRCSEQFIAAGAVLGTEELYEQLRVEAGFPTYGVDISDDNLAQEANRTKLAISFNKGCYLGQEPIARLDSMGHVNRALCQIVTEVPATVPVGAEVYSAADSAESSGTLSSSIVWPVTGQTMGLGLLRRDLARDGLPCWVGHDRVPARVHVK